MPANCPGWIFTFSVNENVGLSLKSTTSLHLSRDMAIIPFSWELWSSRPECLLLGICVPTTAWYQNEQSRKRAVAKTVDAIYS